jgi:hypothetical protein
MDGDIEQAESGNEKPRNLIPLGFPFSCVAHLLLFL